MTKTEKILRREQLYVVTNYRGDLWWNSTAAWYVADEALATLYTLRSEANRVAMEHKGVVTKNKELEK